MATWPHTIRSTTIVSLLAAVVGLVVVYFVITLGGPLVWIAVGVLALAGLGIALRRHGVQKAARAWASTDRFSFAEMAVRMQAREHARTVAAEQRRAELLGAR